ncbi:MAG: hypothetical protein Q9160_008981 [Pyrenula sp. 1 TL-2023]
MTVLYQWDLEFHQILANTSTTTNSSIYKCNPSTLNFGNCSFTQILTDLWINPDLKPDGDHKMSPEFLNTSLSIELLRVLPESYNDTLPKDVLAYWHMSQLIPSFEAYIFAALQPCTADPQSDPVVPYNEFNLTMKPIMDPDLSKNCAAATELWNRTSVFRQTTWDDHALRPLLLDLLMPSYPTPSRAWLKVHNTDDIATGFNIDFAAKLAFAARKCSSGACISLQFSGNADIAGIGVCAVNPLAKRTRLSC